MKTFASEAAGFPFDAMACDCEVRIAGLPDHLAEPLVKKAIAEVRRIEAKFSHHRVDSVVSRINAAAGTGEAVPVDAETAHLLDLADSLHGLSDGRFDATSGALRQAWDFSPSCVPGPAALRTLLPRVGWQQVRWEREGRSAGRIELPVDGMQLDFGGFAKEYAADRAATLLQSLGAAHGMVRLGGDIRLMGPRPDGSPWRIGIPHPREPGRLLGQVALREGALATSGGHERRFESGGRGHGHVLDPRTGWPVTAWASITVVAPACLAAGGLSIVAMLQEHDAPAFLRAQQVGFLAASADGVLHRHAVDTA